MHRRPQKTEWSGFFFGEMAVPYLQGADTGAALTGPRVRLIWVHNRSRVMDPGGVTGAEHGSG